MENQKTPLFEDNSQALVASRDAAAVARATQEVQAALVIAQRFPRDEWGFEVKKLGKQIVVVDNGFVHVGDCSIQDGFLRINRARNIRVWGTSKGLGELRNGPTEKTVFDEAGTILIPTARIVFFLEVFGGWL